VLRRDEERANDIRKTGKENPSPWTKKIGTKETGGRSDAGGERFEAFKVFLIRIQFRARAFSSGRKKGVGKRRGTFTKFQEGRKDGTLHGREAG